MKAGKEEKEDTIVIPVKGGKKKFLKGKEKPEIIWVVHTLLFPINTRRCEWYWCLAEFGSICFSLFAFPYLLSASWYAFRCLCLLLLSFPSFFYFIRLSLHKAFFRGSILDACFHTPRSLPHNPIYTIKSEASEVPLYSATDISSPTSACC